MNDKPMFTGCGTAMVTPFKNGEVDFDAFSELVRRQLEAGMHFLVPLATTGETPCLENDEKLQLLVRCREIVDDYEQRTGRRVPVVVGAGTNSLRQTVRNMDFFSPHGADAFLVVVPYYNKPTQKGQYEYFKAVAEATDKPVIIYNVPGRTGANMEASTCIRLAQDVPNIVGIKEASGKFSQIADIIAGVPKSFSVLSGDDDITMSMMNAGAAGVISVASNAIPELMVEFVEALGAPQVCGADFVSDPDMARSAELFYRLRPFFSACFVESNPIPVKAALALMGLIHNELRLPLVPCSANTENLMREVLGKLGYLK